MSIDSAQQDIPAAFQMEDRLPDDLPGDPFPTFARWFNAAYEKRIQPNPNAMTLATIDPDGRPSARVVLCKYLVENPGYIVFFTNRNSRKADALGANPHAAVVFHWDRFDKQVRIEGPVVRSPESESDRYFASRSAGKRIGAWSSDQSKPIGSRQELLAQVLAFQKKFGVDPDAEVEPDPETVPRPPHWGGFRIWAQNVELWVGNRSRIHDRARWVRELEPATGPEGEDSFTPGGWSATRLQP
jgi:pyridoxamine 5'-phosphate oxidase